MVSSHSPRPSLVLTSKTWGTKEPRVDVLKRGVMLQEMQTLSKVTWLLTARD